MIPSGDGSLIHRSLKNHEKLIAGMESERSAWFTHWRDLAQYFIPRRYPSLLGTKEYRGNDQRNKKLLDSTSVIALNILASGMMNGITSPARKWFDLKVRGVRGKVPAEISLWVEEVRDILLDIFAESNFYDAIAVLFREWCGFGTSAMTIREDFETVIRCYNHPLGEFFLSVDATGRVNRMARKFSLTLEQTVQEFGLENLPLNMQKKYEQGGSNLFTSVEICHVIEENDNDGLIETNSPFREVYWKAECKEGDGYLKTAPLFEWPSITPRWEKVGNSSYGISPTMEVLGDVIQLQHMVLRQGQGLDKLIRPPLILDQALRNRPKALEAGGLTYAPNINANFGAKTVMDLRVPFQELDIVMDRLRTQIREGLYNNLFNMISQLETVRTATEIDARREEKLVHLGPVLERFYNEGLSPLIKRVYGIAQRAELIPPAPEGFENISLEISFVSILSNAQKASDVAVIERFLGFAGNLAAVYPEATQVPNAVELLRQYGNDLGIRPTGIRSEEEIQEIADAQAEQAALQQASEIAKNFGAGAQALGNVDVGGGANAAQALLAQ